MIISPPFLPAAGLTAADNAANLPRLDPMMDLVDTFELAHGTYRKLKDEGEFYHGNDAGYAAFLKLLESFQFWDKTGLPAGQKL
ncbi:hypothetical protein [Caballeronia sp. GAOx1]|nr:hypothetical protein [Caballeronia sp. GAOx1]